MVRLFIIPLLVFVLATGLFLVKHTTAFASFRFSRATILIPQLNNASYYNIYYKSQGDNSFIHAVGQIPNTATSYTITYLRRGVSYQYYVTYVDSLGNQYQITPIKWIQNIQNMN